MAKKKDKERIRKGKVVRLSEEVQGYLDSLLQTKVSRSGREFREGYDSLLRRHFGLKAKNGHPQPLRCYYIIDTPTQLIVRRTLAEARGEEILLAVKRGQKLNHKQRKDGIVTVRELP